MMNLLYKGILKSAQLFQGIIDSPSGHFHLLTGNDGITG